METTNGSTLTLSFVVQVLHRLYIMYCVVMALACFVCSKSSGSAAFTGVSWSCLLVRSVFSTPEKREGPLWKKMVSEKSSTWQAWTRVGHEGFHKLTIYIVIFHAFVYIGSYLMLLYIQQDWKLYLNNLTFQHTFNQSDTFSSSLF